MGGEVWCSAEVLFIRSLGVKKTASCPFCQFIFRVMHGGCCFTFTIYVMGESIQGVIVAKPSCQPSSKHAKGEADHGWRQTKGDMTG